MSQTYDTPQDAEDALYDALEDGDLERVMNVWENSEDIACLLPMQPLARGREAVRGAYEPLLAQGRRIAIAVTHIHWYESDQLAFHLIEEQAEPQGPAGGRPPLAIYATNIYRKGPHGWKLLVHQNAPTPPPPEMMAGIPPRG